VEHQYRAQRLPDPDDVTVATLRTHIERIDVITLRDGTKVEKSVVLEGLEYVVTDYLSWLQRAIDERRLHPD